MAFGKFLKGKIFFIVFFLSFSFVLSGCTDEHSFYMNSDFPLTYEVGSAEPNWLSGIIHWSSKEDFVDTKDMTFESDVDMNTVGTYTVKYFDEYGTERKSVEISIVDTTVPTIKFRPDLNRVVYVGVPTPNFESYIDIVSDNYYEVSKSDVVIDSSDFDGSVIGEYDVLYILEDSDGNSTTETIVFEVRERPVLDINLSSYNFTLQVGSEKPDFDSLIIGASGIDGYISRDHVQVDSSDIDMSTLGVYEVIFTITYQGVVEDIRYDVTVVDTEKPVVVLDDTLPVLFYGECTVEDFMSYVVSVSDNYDSLTTDDIVITNPMLNTTTPGIFNVLFTVTDSSDNETVETLEIIIVLLENPVINLDPNFAVEYNIGDPIPNFYEAIESIDLTFGEADIQDVRIYEGAISGSYHYELDELDWTTPGEYDIRFVYTSHYGLHGFAYLKITKGDFSAPVIELDDTLPTTFLARTEEPDWATYITSVVDNVDTVTNDDVTISSLSANMDTPGEFTIGYSITDAALNICNKELVITVLVNNNPEINLNPIFRMMYGVLGDLPDLSGLVSSVTSVDNSVTKDDVVIDTSSVNMNVVGDYPVVLSVTDGEGRTETITVVLEIRDTTNATLTWNYDFDLELTLGAEMPDFINAVSTVSDNYVEMSLDDVVIDSSSVDMNIEGEYTVYFTISDGSSFGTYSRVFTVIERSRLFKVEREGDLEILNSIPFEGGNIFVLEDDNEIFVVQFNSNDEVDYRTTIYDKTVSGFSRASIYSMNFINSQGNLFISGYYRTDTEFQLTTWQVFTDTGVVQDYISAPIFVFEYSNDAKVVCFLNWVTNEMFVYDDSIHSIRLITNPANDYNFIYPNIIGTHENHFVMYEEHSDGSMYITLFKDNFIQVSRYAVTESDQYGFMGNLFYVTNGNNEINVIDLTDSSSDTYVGPYVIGSEYIFTSTHDVNGYTITKIDPSDNSTMVFDKHDDFAVNHTNNYLYTVDYDTDITGDISILSIYRPKESVVTETITGHNISIYKDSFTGNVYYVNEVPGNNELFTYFDGTGMFYNTLVSDTSSFDMIVADGSSEYHLFFTTSDVNETTVYIKQDGIVNTTSSIVLNHSLTDINVVYSGTDFIIFSGHDDTTEYLYNLYLTDNSTEVYTSNYNSNSSYQDFEPIIGINHATIISRDSILSFTFDSINTPQTVIDTMYTNTEVRVYKDAYNGLDIIMISYDVSNGTDYTEFYVGHIEDGISSMTMYSYDYRFTSLLIDDASSIKAYGYIKHENQAMLLFSDQNQELFTTHYFGSLFYVVDEVYFEYRDFFETQSDIEVIEDIYTR